MATEDRNQPSPGGAIGVDVGGTFTDAVVVVGGRVCLGKAPTTPDDQGEGVIAAIRLALSSAGPVSVAVFAHGTTTGTNALLERRGATTALVATAGFGDVLELRRQDRAHLYRLEMHHPPPLVPPERVVEVAERSGPAGVVAALEDEEIDRVVAAVAATGAESVALGLLFSFAHPDHETRLARAIRARLPHVHVSTSSEVLPEIREYERISTTVVDAYLGPVVGRYLRHLGTRAVSDGLPAPRVMQSNGGLIGLEDAGERASRTVLSGPAAGVIGAAFVAAAAGETDVLTLDMGGTSCDVAVISDGAPARAAGARIAGLAVQLPVLDVVTVSAGGGSIAWVDAGGALRVGPRSAGARPGPAAYGRGGSEPTVTDANVVLGRLGARALPGGIALDGARARAALAPLASALDLGLESCAEAVLAVAVQEMVSALRLVSVERGVDPRGRSLVAFGGAGPLHACQIAEALGMTRVLAPRAAGLLAALGLVVAPERRDFVRTILLPCAAADRLAAAFADLAARARREVPDGRLLAAADCRYAGQRHHLTVDWVRAPDPATLVTAFHDAHRARYGDADPAASVEVVSLRVAAEGPAPRIATRTVEPGPEISGDALVDLDGATCWIAPGWSAHWHPSDVLVCERAL